MRISDWSSDVCSSDRRAVQYHAGAIALDADLIPPLDMDTRQLRPAQPSGKRRPQRAEDGAGMLLDHHQLQRAERGRVGAGPGVEQQPFKRRHHQQRSEEHTSELQSLMRITYAFFCLIKTNINTL